MEKKIWTPSEMGKKGGKKSAQTRLGKLTAKERSEAMRKIRFSKHEFTKKEKKELKEAVAGMVEGMKKATR